MSDLTYCYLHMTDYELKALDTLETPLYLDGLLPDEDMVLPAELIPPNPEEHESLPSQTHPSYPFGNPTHVKHPAARPRPFAAHDPTMHMRALFEDMGLAPTTIPTSVRWTDLALDSLLPVNEEKELAKQAASARTMASGSGVPATAAAGQQPPQMNQDASVVDTTTTTGEDDDAELSTEEETDEDEDEDGSEDEY